MNVEFKKEWNFYSCGFSQTGISSIFNNDEDIVSNGLQYFESRLNLQSLHLIDFDISKELPFSIFNFNLWDKRMIKQEI